MQGLSLSSPEQPLGIAAGLPAIDRT
jgi:hypothetical protein